MKKYIKTIAGLIFFVLLDQVVKLWVLARLKGQEPIVLIKNVLEFQYVENRGAAFGLLQNRQWFFLVISFVVLIGLAYLAKKIPQESRYFWLRFCMFFVAAGAIGNMIDRALRQYVVDFIYFKLINFPVFNVADIYVTCSAFLLIYLVIFYYKEEEIDRIFSKEKKEEKE
ncbi:MAG: signal peptidase II [Eubacteriales bacterium]|nr:signal peptidase II [Eubacteriales bacterium]